MDNVAVIGLIAGAVVILARVIDHLVHEVTRRRNNKPTPGTNNPHSDHDMLIKILERQTVLINKMDRVITLIERTQ